MRVARLTVKPDADGMLRFTIPAGGAGGEYDVAVVVAPRPATNAVHAAKTLQELGYPPGWERVYGSISDETFVAPPDLPPSLEFAGEAGLPAKTPEELGWPPGYFEKTAGSIPDPAFGRGD